MPMPKALLRAPAFFFVCNPTRMVVLAAVAPRVHLSDARNYSGCEC